MSMYCLRRTETEDFVKKLIFLWGVEIANLVYFTKLSLRKQIYGSC